MTSNDTAPASIPGQWIQIDPSQSTAILANSTSGYVQLYRSSDAATPATDGIVLNQTVFVGIILLLGIIAGVMLMMILDKYHK